jgi:glycerol-3-phosphate acyltransferase PlsX
LRDFAGRINPARYNGASFLGLTATLVKSHGSADVEAFSRAIETAFVQAQANIPQRISEKLPRGLQAF